MATSIGKLSKSFFVKILVGIIILPFVFCGMGEKSGGQREFVPYLARAAIAVGVGAIFIETHDDPDNAPSDGPNMVPLNEVKTLLKKLTEIDKLIK